MQSSLKVLSITAASSLIEPEDARITGLTRSLPRRLLALNMPALPEARKTAVSAAVYQPQARIA